MNKYYLSPHVRVIKQSKIHQGNFMSKVIHLCLTLCDPIGSMVHWIFQARIPERVAFPFSRGSSQPRDRTQISHIAGRLFTNCATKPTTLLNVLKPNIYFWKKFSVN